MEYHIRYYYLNNYIKFHLICKLKYFILSYKSVKSSHTKGIPTLDGNAFCHFRYAIDNYQFCQFLLHSIDLTAQRRLRNKQALRCFCKTQTLRHRYKIFDLIKSHLPCSSLYLYAPFLCPILSISVFIHPYVRFYPCIYSFKSNARETWCVILVSES